MLAKLTLPKLLQLWALIAVVFHAGLLIFVIPGIEADDRLLFFAEVAAGIIGFIALQITLLTPVVKFITRSAWLRSLGVATHMLLLSHICVTLPLLLSQLILGLVDELLVVNNLSGLLLMALSITWFLIGWILIQFYVLQEYTPRLDRRRAVLGLLLANLLLILGPLVAFKLVYSL